MRRSLLGAVVVLLLAVSASAQEALVVRFYLVPRVGAGVKGNPFRAKYIIAGELGADWQLGPTQTLDYGTEDIYLIAVAVTAAQHTTLSAQPDVMAVPSPIDDQVSPVALTAIQDRLEAMHLPGSWVTTDTTYRQVLRTTLRIIMFAQRYDGLFHGFKIFDTGVTLDTKFNQLTAPQRQRLSDVADSLQIDRTGLAGAMTLRQLLRLLADQLAPVTIVGEVFD